jgi:hypothetical protein
LFYLLFFLDNLAARSSVAIGGNRIVALLFSDGEPSEPEDTWQQAFNELTSTPQFPNLVPIGI